jgi:hypothetical protein
MAKALGDVTKSQVQRLYEQGMPKHSAEAARAWRLQNLELSRTADSRIDRPQASAQNVSVPVVGGLTSSAGGAGAATPAPAGAEETDDTPDQADENTSAYRADRARNERIKADRAEMELQQLRGELVPARAVADMQYTVARIVRDRLLMVPGRAATDLHALAISLVPEEHHATVAKALPAHTLERRLEDEIRAALDDAAKACAQAGRDDDDDDAD